MEWIGWVSLVLILCYAAYPEKVRRLESRMKKLQKTQSGGLKMSKIMSELVGERCRIKTDEAFAFVGSGELTCRVLEADDEWIKLCYTDRKNAEKIRILRIDSIQSVELIQE